jgi:hypothetical protein
MGLGHGSLRSQRMSALGQKRTWRDQIAMSALPSKADITERDHDVRLALTPRTAFPREVPWAL